MNKVDGVTFRRHLPHGHSTLGRGSNVVRRLVRVLSELPSTHPDLLPAAASTVPVHPYVLKTYLDCLDHGDRRREAVRDGELRERLKEIRKSRGWTQDRVADWLGVHTSTVSGFERKQRPLPIHAARKVLDTHPQGEVESGSD